jgi:hypothetical protein
VDDVLRLGGPIAERLALMTPDSDPFRFDASSAPSLPPSAVTDRIVITRSHHQYNGCWRADRLELYATRQTLRVLGVIVVASLFAQPDSSADITLSHPASDIRTLRIRTPPASDPLNGLALAPLWYDYWPQQPHKHPWDDGDRVDPEDLPALYLTSHDELGPHDGEWLVARNTVVGFGTLQGIARFGQFLIDIGNPVTGDEYDLEGEVGFRGVAPLSAELKISLPGSFGWEPRFNLN